MMNYLRTWLFKIINPTIKFRREVSDYEGHYDLDGVSMDEQGVIVAGDARRRRG